jgi:hypothetical protein
MPDLGSRTALLTIKANSRRSLALVGSHHDTCAPLSGLVGAHSMRAAFDLAERPSASALRRWRLWVGTIAAVRVYRRHRVIELVEAAREGQGLVLELPHELLCVERARRWQGLLLDPPLQPVRACFVGSFDGTEWTPTLAAHVWRSGHVWLAASWCCGFDFDRSAPNDDHM